MKKVFTILGVAFAFALIPKFVLAATLFLSPSSGNFSVGQTFSVSVRTNTQADSVNTAEATINYSTDTLELVSVSQGSTFYLPAPSSPSKGSGTAYFGGGVPTPGYNGASGVIGTMTFRGKSAGTATVSISSGKVLLNDGQGTNSLSGSSGARFNITPPAVGTVEVSSATHPDPNAWYTKPDVELSWSRPSGAYGFSFELDQKEDTIPDNELDTTITTTKSYPDLKDGVWYFHIKSRGQSSGSAFGDTVHFRIGVDREKPLLFDIKTVGQTDLNDVSRTPTISFEANDEISGIDRYDVYLDDKLIQEKTESPYTFSKLENGPHVIRVVAADKAGNDRKAELPIIVQGPAVTGFFQQQGLYILLGVNLLVLILVLLLIWFLFRRKKKKTTHDDEVAAIQAEIDASLDTLKQEINQKLIKLAAREKTAAEVTVKVNNTKKRIDKKLGSLKKAVKK